MMDPTINDNKRVIIFDTTLRDGEQSPGASLKVDEKVQVAHQLARLGVDVIEAGFAVSSPGDFEAVRRIALEVEGPIICSLARALPRDVDAAGKALAGARRTRIHVFISTSEIHLRYQFRKTRAEALEMARETVRRARGYTDDVEFSPMDATRTEPSYLYEVLHAAIEAGATTVNIPDTVGYATPDEIITLMKGIFAHVPNIHNAIVSTHCHDDLGMATANSLAAVHCGARQIECTINGIGERAGNAALEEVVMALNTRRNFFGLYTGIDTTQIMPTSRMVSHLMNMPVQPNKAIVGANAFAHESGIHQDGVLKERSTYEIIDARAVGLDDSTLVLGKHSGRHAFRERLTRLGYTLDAEALNRAFVRFKEVADTKKEVGDTDLELIVAEMWTHRLMSDSVA